MPDTRKPADRPHPGPDLHARLYAEQIPALWQFGPVTVADHRRDDSMAAIARRILAAAPSAFRARRPVDGRLYRLRDHAPGAAARGKARFARHRRARRHARADRAPPRADGESQGRRLRGNADLAYPLYVHRNRHNDAALKSIVRTMVEETGLEAYLRQQQAIIGRPDSRPGLAAISLQDADAGRRGRRGDAAGARARDRRRHSGCRLVIVPGSGHLSTLEKPEAVNKALVEWMQW